MVARTEEGAMDGRDIWGELIPLGDWGSLVDEYLRDPAKGPIVQTPAPAGAASATGRNLPPCRVTRLCSFRHGKAAAGAWVLR